MLEWLLQNTIKPITYRLRAYFQADIMTELASIRADIANIKPAALENLDDLGRAVENALLTLAVLGVESKQGQGGFAPLDPPLRAQPRAAPPLEPKSGR
jgi:hypothetical protein